MAPPLQPRQQGLVGIAQQRPDHEIRQRLEQNGRDREPQHLDLAGWKIQEVQPHEDHGHGGQNRPGTPAQETPRQAKKHVKLDLRRDRPQHADAGEKQQVGGQRRPGGDVVGPPAEERQQHHRDVERQHTGNAGLEETQQVAIAGFAPPIQVAHQKAREHEEQHHAQLPRALPQQLAPGARGIAEVRHDDDQRGGAAQGVQPADLRHVSPPPTRGCRAGMPPAQAAAARSRRP